MKRNGVALKTGKLVLGERRLSTSVTLPSDAGDGVYLVKHKACWADRTCDDGQVGLNVDSRMGM